APFPIEILEVEHVRDEHNSAWIGRSSGELAQERGGDALDAFLDVSIAEDLATGWRTRPNPAAQAFISNVVREAVPGPLVLAGSSDGGAHLASFTGADYHAAAHRLGARHDLARARDLAPRGHAGGSARAGRPRHDPHRGARRPGADRSREPRRARTHR